MKYTILAIAGVVLSSLRILGKVADHNKPEWECGVWYGDLMIPCALGDCRGETGETLNECIRLFNSLKR